MRPSGNFDRAESRSPYPWREPEPNPSGTSLVPKGPGRGQGGPGGTGAKTGTRAAFPGCGRSGKNARVGQLAGVIAASWMCEKRGEAAQEPLDREAAGAPEADAGHVGRAENRGGGRGDVDEGGKARVRPRGRQRDANGRADLQPAPDGRIKTSQNFRGSPVDEEVGV